nr:hypothetical protein MJEJOPCA_00030 [Escherichia sp.]
MRRDVTPNFVAAELIVWLNEHKIIRPSYTTLQALVSEVLSAERRRLGALLAQVLDEPAKTSLSQLSVRNDTLSQLAALKQDAKDFGWRQMAREREKRTLLAPLHWIAKGLLPKLGISQQNLLYYASLANFYTVHDLRNLKPEQTLLYLLCYARVRYRQLSDNSVDAMAFHMHQLDHEKPRGCEGVFRRRAGQTSSGNAPGWSLAVPVRGRQCRGSDAIRRGTPARLQDHGQRRAAKTRRSA